MVVAEDVASSARVTAAGWREAGAALAAVRATELASLTDEDALQAARDLLDLVADLPPREGGSGLVEQQRLFALLRS